MQVGCSGPVPSAVPAQSNLPLPEDSPARPFVGSYRFVGGDTERTNVDKAIDDSISSMSALIRGIARGRLKAANQVPDQLTFRGDARTFAVLVDDRQYVGNVDGSPLKVETVTGDVMDLRYKFGPMLEQSFSDEEKERVNTFELRGSQLIMHVRVHAGQLPKDVVYDLTFERV